MVREFSAGGVVLRKARQGWRIAVIEPQREAWVVGSNRKKPQKLLLALPKGLVDPGETPEQTAVREVKEETGITGEVVRALGSIDYWFVAENRRVHKTVHHYLLVALSGELSDEDTEVTEVAWVALDDLDDRLAYADERRLVRKAMQLLSDHASAPFEGEMPFSDGLDVPKGRKP